MTNTPLLVHRPRVALLAAALPLALGAAVVDNVRIRRQLHAARRDPLTGLALRPELTARGEKLAARPGTVALFVDANGFKAINDTHGHDAGNAILTALAQRLSRWCRTHRGLAARLGGDEFAAVAHLPGTSGGLDRALAGLQQVLERPVLYEQRLLPASVAIGAAPVSAMPGSSWSLALRAADTAMYRAKRDRSGPRVGTAADALAEASNGRRPGRPGTAGR